MLARWFISRLFLYLVLVCFGGGLLVMSYPPILTYAKHLALILGLLIGADLLWFLYRLHLSSTPPPESPTTDHQDPST